ncbi:MAG: DUF370 domain-containing protein [Dehalococcoidia bacterium]|nr:DUF370 domain-containing protein [Dehalococcoidia bacterium]
MNVQLVHVGFGNIVALNRVVAITSPDSAPIKRLIQEARTRNAVIDLTSGRKTKAVLVLDTGDVVLTALAPETIASRATAGHTILESKNAEVKDTHE